MNIFDQYGLKEVANVTFYDIATGVPVLFLDSLKVSTIETTAENVEARGGWGNPALISWDYNKEVTVTLEDALFSAASLKTIMGAGIDVAKAEAIQTIDVNEELTVDATGKVKLSYTPKADTKVAFLDEDIGEYASKDFTGREVTIGDESDKDKLVTVFYKTEVKGDDATGNAVTITISSNKFGGTYRVVGDTIVRSKKTGEDEPFQFVIEKAKIQNEVTFTMEAEGDPATFNLPLKVLRDDHSTMFKLIKYNIPVAQDWIVPSLETVRLDKTVGELIGDDVKVADDGSVSGRIKHVTDYEEYWPGNTEMQKGNFFPIDLKDVAGEKIAVKKNGVQTKEIDFDPEWVLKVDSPEDTFEFIIDGKSIITLNFKKATLLSE